MGQIDQLLRRVAGAPVRTVRRWRSRGISWKVITSNPLPVPSLSIIHHHYLPELEMVTSCSASWSHIQPQKGNIDFCPDSQ